jgi:hypothetical protein
MTPEKAYGRLINLREQLTGKDAFEPYSGTSVYFAKDVYAVIIDDLDDVIRSIERRIKKGDLCQECGQKYEDDDYELEDDRDEDECRRRKK